MCDYHAKWMERQDVARGWREGGSCRRSQRGRRSFENDFDGKCVTDDLRGFSLSVADDTNKRPAPNSNGESPESKKPREESKSAEAEAQGGRTGDDEMEVDEPPPQDIATALVSDGTSSPDEEPAGSTIGHHRQELGGESDVAPGIGKDEPVSEDSMVGVEVPIIRPAVTSGLLSDGESSDDEDAPVVVQRQVAGLALAPAIAPAPERERIVVQPVAAEDPIAEDEPAMHDQPRDVAPDEDEDMDVEEEDPKDDFPFPHVNSEDEVAAEDDSDGESVEHDSDDEVGLSTDDEAPDEARWKKKYGHAAGYDPNKCIKKQLPLGQYLGQLFERLDADNMFPRRVDRAEMESFAGQHLIMDSPYAQEHLRKEQNKRTRTKAELAEEVDPEQLSDDEWARFWLGFRPYLRKTMREEAAFRQAFGVAVTPGHPTPRGIVDRFTTIRAKLVGNGSRTDKVARPTQRFLNAWDRDGKLIDSGRLARRGADCNDWLIDAGLMRRVKLEPVDRGTVYKHTKTDKAYVKAPSVLYDFGKGWSGGSRDEELAFRQKGGVMCFLPVGWEPNYAPE